MENNIILPGESTLKIEDEKTMRSKKREKEDQKYLSVILKRNDQVVRHPDDILEKAIHEGVEQHKRSNLSLLLSSISAGLILGFASMSVSLASQIFDAQSHFILNRIVTALFYPLGFIICILSGTQLFTEHTAIAVFPVLDKKAALKSLIRLLVIVLLGNLLGTLMSSFLIASADIVILAKAGLLNVYEHIIHFTFTEVLISSILAGWLMAQGGWLILATSSSISQMMSIYIVTFLIGLGGLHHSIAGSAEIFGGLMLSSRPDYYLSFMTLLSAIIGNFIGGSFFVAILNYAHIKKTQ